MLGGAVMIAVGLAFGGGLTTVSTKGIILLVYLMLVSAIAYSVWSILIKHNTVSKIAVFGFMTPIFGFVLSLIFDSASGVSLFLALPALLLAVIGIVLVNKTKE